MGGINTYFLETLTNRLSSHMLKSKVWSFPAKWVRVVVVGGWLVGINMKTNSVKLKLKLPTGTELGN